MTTLPLAYSAPPVRVSPTALATAKGTGLLALIFGGGIFGFFYAWVCSTMWGLDAADPRVAIEAMQFMNASVRNAVFAPAFFGTPFVMALAALAALHADRRASAVAFAAGAAIYALGGMLFTMVINVPMNEALALVVVPDNVDEARAIWAAYSTDWQVYNVARTVFSGLALACVGIGLLRL